jgi:hypothetical protein
MIKSLSLQAALETKRSCMGYFAIFAKVFVGSYFGKVLLRKLILTVHSASSNQ